MKILLYSLNYSPELTGIGKYSGEMCEWLAEHGHDVRVICAPPYYPEWQVDKPYRSWQFRTEQRNKVTVFRCPLYVPKKPKTLSRLIHLFSFGFSSLPVLFKQWSWKPDIVICIEPAFFCVPATVLFCKLRNIKSLLHIQDFELDAMLGLGLGRSGIVSQFAGQAERWFMRRFDAISTISYSMLQKAKDKTNQPEKVFYFPNWVDTDFLTPDADPDLFRKRWGIAESTRVVLYSGNMGKKQGLEIVLQAADQFRQEPDLLFLMIGNGAAQEELMRQAEQMRLDNLRFYPLQPYEELPALMALADIHLVVQKKGAADAVMPSKLTAILAVGGECVITAEANTELGLLCQEYPGIARRIEPENVDALATALREMQLNLPAKSLGFYNEVAHQFALNNLKKDQILSRLVSKLEGQESVSHLYQSEPPALPENSSGFGLNGDHILSFNYIDSEKALYSPDWADTDFLTPDADPNMFRQRWGIAESTRVVLYSGNMGKKQGLEIVLQAAYQFRQEPDLLFLMIGNGAAQEELMRQAEQMRLDNLRFYPLQPYKDLPALMALADIHLVVQKKRAADAVMPSKLTTILAVGGECVITAEANTELGLLCQEYPGIARRIEPENVDALATTLREMQLNLPSKSLSSAEI